ncbi:MAG: hemin uptake protein HemP [Pseudomonadota bacterium]
MNDSKPTVREMDARELLDETGRLRIRLGDQVYILRLTSQNKLILTK